MTCHTIRKFARNRALGFFSVLAVTMLLFAGPADSAAIAGGESHTVTLKGDGTVWTFGSNAAGQLGNGSTINSSTPVQVTGLSGISSVAAGYAHSVALKSDGTVWTWGYNGLGQLGNGTAADSSTPVQVSGLAGVTAIAAGQYQTVALKNDGTVWAWGANNLGQLGYATTATCAAYNAYPCSLSAAQVSGVTGIGAIAAGASHTLALKSNGTVWAWGANLNGQLGNGSLSFALATPAQVAVLTGVTAIAVGGSMYHNLALKSDGTVWSWGYNGSGQLGTGGTADASTPSQIGTLSGVTSIAGGKNHSLALKNTGTVWAWGENSQGALGNGGTAQSGTPVQVATLSDINAVEAGGYHSVARKNEGSVWAWGKNDSGQIGNGGTGNASTAVEVVGNAGAGFLSLDAANYSGLFYNPAESGWGVSMAHHPAPNNVIFAVWYAYDALGSPTWYVLSNCPVSGNSCSGDIFKTGGTPLGQPWNASKFTIAKAGTGTIVFSDQNNASLTYSVDGTIGVKTLSKQTFATGASLPNVNYSDIWYSAAEAGWGMSITQQYGISFVGWYAYDASGKPIWYVVSACAMAFDNKSCSGDVYQTTGTFFGASWDPAKLGISKVGAMSISFTNANTATFSATVNGMTTSKSISRLGF